MLTLGKLAALAASARIATRQQDRARRLAERVELTREVHENAIQRLFGGLARARLRARAGACRSRALPRGDAQVLADLRTALERQLGPRRSQPPAPPCASSSTGCGSGYADVPVEITGSTGWRCRSGSSRWPSRCSPRRCATATATRAPTRIDVARRTPTSETFTLAVENDGVRRRRATRGGGIGLRLAALEALRYGGHGRVRAAGGDAGGCASSSRSGVTDERASGSCGVLVVDDHDVVQWGFRLLLERQSWVERCLAARGGAEAVELCRRCSPTSRWSTCCWASESGAEVCEEIRAVSPATRVLLISGAGVISPQASPAPPAPPASSPRTGRRSTSSRRCGWSRWADRVRPPSEDAPRLAALRARAGGAGADRHRLHQQGDRRPPAPLAAHGQGAHQRHLPQARRPQPGRGDAPGAGDGVDCGAA